VNIKIEPEGKEIEDKIEIKVKEKGINVIESAWKPEIIIDENKNLILTTKIDKNLDTVKDILLYKDKQNVTPNEHIKIEIINNEDNTESISLEI
jgi:hypothetical protein